MMAAAGFCLADAPAIKVSPSADFSNPAMINSNVRDECKLPESQAAASMRALQEAGVTAETAPEDQLKANGYYLKLRLENAVSMGNAFIGHRKFVAMSAQLYKDGKLLDTFTGSRDSMGGMWGGFKGSCSVLERCTQTLSKDLAAWVKTKLSS
ncbi:hypothetical protein C2I19_05395 [Chromobacterium alticapitis]|uniref:DUF4410 domain-containing protein n=2 Tax=Chromobacterium alticapitis TaxID=2073169 RepID=A0A2S5DJP0_9NEIS|nr:hypothetical protein C2I19_05395 [Chromobacterium alticapitis]